MKDLFVVPTPVGVFPKTLHSLCAGFRRPHARGGVSEVVDFLFLRHMSSPRPWGCFYQPS